MSKEKLPTHFQIGFHYNRLGVGFLFPKQTSFKFAELGLSIY